MAEGSAATDVRQAFSVRVGPQPGPQSFSSRARPISPYTAARLAAVKRSPSCSSRSAMSATRTLAPSSSGAPRRRSRTRARFGMRAASSIRCSAPSRTRAISYWTFPSGATVSFKHLEHDKTVLNWQGCQIPLIAFDELMPFQPEAILVHGQPQSLDVRRAPVHSGDLQPGRR